MHPCIGTLFLAGSSSGWRKSCVVLCSHSWQSWSTWIIPRFKLATFDWTVLEPIRGSWSSRRRVRPRDNGGSVNVPCWQLVENYGSGKVDLLNLLSTKQLHASGWSHFLSFRYPDNMLKSNHGLEAIRSTLLQPHFENYSWSIFLFLIPRPAPISCCLERIDIFQRRMSRSLFHGRLSGARVLVVVFNRIEYYLLLLARKTFMHLRSCWCLYLLETRSSPSAQLPCVLRIFDVFQKNACCLPSLRSLSMRSKFCCDLSST